MKNKVKFLRPVKPVRDQVSGATSGKPLMTITSNRVSAWVSGKPTFGIVSN